MVRAVAYQSRPCTLAIRNATEQRIGFVGHVGRLKTHRSQLMFDGW